MGKVEGKTDLSNEDVDEFLDGDAKDATAAFDAGYNSEEMEVDDDWGDDEVSHDEDEDPDKDAPDPDAPKGEESDDDQKLKKPEGEETDPDPDPDPDKPKGEVDNSYEGLLTRLERAENMAKSASGRAAKLQSDLAKLNQSGEKKGDPAPTASQIIEALSSTDKMDGLRREFPEYGEVLDEYGKSMTKAFEAQERNFSTLMQKSAQELRAISRLDNAHPSWEDDIHSKEFESWLWEGGPSEEERTEYFRLVQQGESGKASPGQADDYFSLLMEQYPDWAEDRGKLYGDPSTQASIDLLSKYKGGGNQKPSNEGENKRRRLEGNVRPTTGKTGDRIPEKSQAAEEAFDTGFYGTQNR